MLTNFLPRLLIFAVNQRDLILDTFAVRVARKMRAKNKFNFQPKKIMTQKLNWQKTKADYTVDQTANIFAQLCKCHHR